MYIIDQHRTTTVCDNNVVKLRLSCSTYVLCKEPCHLSPFFFSSSLKTRTTVVRVAKTVLSPSRPRCKNFFQMNELLNRWRHGEVNLLQRRFRLARAQTVKPTIASKILGTLAPPSSSSGTGTSAATSANRDTSFGDDASTSPASHDGVPDAESRKAGEGTGTAPEAARLGGGSGDVEEAMPVGGVGGARAGMDKEAFLRVFPDVQVRKETWEGGGGGVMGGPAPMHCTVLSS